MEKENKPKIYGPVTMRTLRDLRLRPMLELLPALETLRKLQQVYEGLEPALSPKKRKYFRKMFSSIKRRYTGYTG